MINKNSIEDRKGRVAFEYIRDRFKESNPHTMGKLSGTKYNEYEKFFEIFFLGKYYKVRYPEGEVLTSEGRIIKTYSLKILFLRYLINAKGVPLTKKNITYKEIPGGHLYYINFYYRVIAGLAKLFKENKENLIKSIKKIGGNEINIGDIGYRLKLFNNIYLTIILWYGDEDFDPNVNILFDQNTQYYLDAEDLAVMGEIITYVLKNDGNMPL